MLFVRFSTRPVLSLLLLLMLAGCDAPEPPIASKGDEDPVVATHQGGKVLRSDIAHAVSRRVARLGAAATPEARRSIVAQLVAREARIALLYSDALSEGLQHRGDVAARLAARRDLGLAQEWLDREVFSAIEVPATAVDAETTRRLAVSAPEERRAFSSLFLRAPDEAAKVVARRKLDAIQTRLQQGESFAALAREFSDSISSRAGGTIPPTSRAMLNADLAAIVFGLREGEVSEPVENRDGIHLFRVDTVIPPKELDVDGTRRTVEADLRREARTAALASVRQLALDESGVDLAAATRAVAGDCADDQVLLSLDVPLTCGGYRLLRLRWPDLASVDTQAGLMWLVTNHIFARRLKADGKLAPDEVARIIELAERNELVAAKRDELLAASAAEPSESDLAAHHAELAGVAPQLREFVADLLFFPQRDGGPGEIYAEGERISAQLRAGAPFDQILSDEQARGAARVFAAQGGLTEFQLGLDQPRVRDELMRLASGDVSVPIVIAGNPLRAGGAALIDEKGLLFVRKLDDRTLALQEARSFIEESFRARAQRAARDAIQHGLDQRTAVQILLVDG